MKNIKDILFYIFVFLLPVLYISAFLFCVSNLSSDSPEECCKARFGLAILFVEGLIMGLVAAHEGLKLEKAKTSEKSDSSKMEKRDGSKQKPSALVSSAISTVPNVETPKSILKKGRSEAGSKIEKRVRFKPSYEQIHSEITGAKGDGAIHQILKQLDFDEYCDYVDWVMRSFTTGSMSVSKQSELRKSALSESAVTRSAFRRSAFGTSAFRRSVFSRLSSTTSASSTSASTTSASTTSASSTSAINVLASNTLANRSSMKEEKIDGIDWAERWWYKSKRTFRVSSGTV